MRVIVCAVVLWLGAAATWCNPARGAVPEHVDYARDVLPILSDACYHCHGPDERARKADLHFDTKAGAFRVKDGKTVIVPGKVAESELVRRINSNDPDQKMPPDDGLRKLTPDQVKTLTRWVEQGANWGVHWAFVAPKRSDPPRTTASPGWTRNFIDAFVLAKLEAEKLTPSPEADKATLIRRVTFDLTGLPPTLAEIDAFIADTSPNAYEKVVDRLLASPRYGERMAADWLDLARFADTHGYQVDRERSMWPYRDWVIKAFNQNLPFDQFTLWQIAGDMLPNPTKEQRLATAFNRLHMQNEEGGIVGEEFRVAYIVDRVTTMGTAFLGLTLECSRCHDHKYDPISQRDFYSLFSLFQNVDENGQISFYTGAMPVPTLLLSNSDQDAKLASLEGRIRGTERLARAEREATGVSIAFDRWLRSRGDGPLPDKVPGLVGAYAFDAIKDGKVANVADPSKPAVAVEGPQIIADAPGGAMAKLGGDNGFTFPGVGHFARTDAFSFALRLQPGELPPRQTILHQSRASDDAAGRGLELLLESGHVAFALHHFWPGNSLKVVTRRALVADEATHVTVTYDGSSQAAGVHVYLNGEPAELDVVRDGLRKDITYGTDPAGEPDLAIGFRGRDIGFRNGQVGDFRIYGRELTASETSHVAGGKSFATLWRKSTDALEPAERVALRDYYLANVQPDAKAKREALHALRKQQSDLVNPIAEIMVMKELDAPKPAFVLKRGAYDAPGDPVAGDTPHALPPLPAGQPKNRLAVARWLLAPEQPLTARVTVNRFWQQMFGRGIVETSENFGSQGAQPTHPELLDTLTRAFVDDMHWDAKQLLKTIACSATYRQSSRATPDQLAADPGDHFLSRAPARRLTAEMLRDQSLALGGLLVERLGGPSVRPYQPAGLWDVASSTSYAQSHGDDLYRRSLYTYWKRTVPPPAMMAFDAADRSYCTARRQSTSTPLQSLVLLNDPQIVEAARSLSQRVLKEGGATPEQRLGWAFRLVLGRTATAKEVDVLKEMWTEQHALFSSDAQGAAKLLAVGELKTDASLDAKDVATGTVVVLALLNHDGAVMRR